MEANTNKENMIHEILGHSKKITEALYRITELFPDKEPLKWTLRNESVQVFGLFASLDTAPNPKKIIYVEKISSKISRINHLLEIASLSSFTININFEILKREYEKISALLNDNKVSYFEADEIYTLEESFQKKLIGHNGQGEFREEENLNSNNSFKKTDKEKKEANKESDNNNSKLESFESNEIKENTGLDSVKNEEGEKERKNNEGDKINLNNLGQNDNGHYSDNGQDKTEKELKNGALSITERSKKILNIINGKENNEMGINEIFSHFKGISKKTIQRELGKLVREGCLEMEGVKRWRIYKITGEIKVFDKEI